MSDPLTHDELGYPVTDERINALLLDVMFRSDHRAHETSMMIRALRSQLAAERAARASAEQQRDAAVGALGTVRESVLSPYETGGFMCLVCGQWGKTRDTVKHWACALTQDARAVLASAGEQPASSSQEDTSDV